MTPGERLTVETADVTDVADVTSAFTGVDAVLSCLGAPYSWKPITIYSESARAVVDGMRATKVGRLVVVSAGLTHPVTRGGVRWQRPVYGILRNGPGRTLYADMRRMEDVLSGARDLDWTVMRPARLSNDARPGDEMRVTAELPDGRGWTTRSDLAMSMLDELTTPHTHQSLFITTR
ncbi:NAD(P)H-binding protein [Streptomyces sp. INA 01156]